MENKQMVVVAALALCQIASESGIRYPSARRVNQTDTYHGVEVADPYRWLEDTDSKESREWIDAQSKLAFDYLEKIPQRSVIRNRLTELWNYERYGVPVREGGRYFFTKNDGLQNQNVLYTLDRLEGTPRVLFDPNPLSKDGTVALASFTATQDARYLAYGFAEAGSDWNRIKVREVDTARDLPDEVRWVKFSDAQWSKDGKGFFYSRYDEPKAGAQLKGVNHYHKIYYHRLGMNQSEDALIYERKDQPEWYLPAQVTEDGRYLVISASEGKTVNNAMFYRDLSRPDSPIVELLNKFDAQYGFIANDGPIFWVQTDLDAPRRRVVAIDIRKPGREEWKTVIPQAAEALQTVSVVGERFLATYLRDAQTLVRVHDLSGKYLRDVDLPGIGTAVISGRRKDAEAFYLFTSYVFPSAVYRYDVAAGRSSLFREPKVKFSPTDYETRQVFLKSKDGTRIPMFVTHKKGISLDGTNPTLLYGYGGFSVSLTPSFSVGNLGWMEMGGVYAVANLRGGGEYGEEWHQAGMKTRKQNVFDDFIAAAEWLIANKYTSSRKLAINGGSNGGLLVGACMVQRPELFGAVLPAVGVLDMLRFHKFTVGWGWVADYGAADSKEAAEFKALYAYSPYHNLKKGTCYPKTLITTADHDDRVFPAHSFKFGAALQWAQGCDNPVLVRIETRAGHGAGKPTSKRIEEIADQWAFLVKALEMGK